MKKTTFFTIASLLLGSSAIFAQNAYTKPAGFVKHTLKAGQFNLIGLTLHEQVNMMGTFTAVSANNNGTPTDSTDDYSVLTDTNVNFQTALTANKTYILEITSGALAGTVQEVTTWNVGNNVNTIKTGDDIVSGTGVKVGDKFQMRSAMTLANIFGANNSAGLLGGASSTISDRIYLRTHNGFDTYYYSTGGFFGIGWRKVGSGSIDQANKAVLSTDSFYVYRKGNTDLDLVLTGSVKTVPTYEAITETFNFMSSVYPVGSTLTSSKMKDTITGGASSTLADKIMFRKDGGGFDSYYYSTGGFFGVGWRQVGDGNTDKGDIVLPSAFILHRAGNIDMNVKITPPAGYENL